VTAIIFGSSEVLERTVLAGISMETLRALRLLRGVASSFLVAILVGIPTCGDMHLATWTRWMVSSAARWTFDSRCPRRRV